MTSACGISGIARRLAVTLAVFLVVPANAGAATFTVDRTADDPVSPGTCQAAVANDCSLRQAIAAANATAGPDAIAFAIPGAGVKTIAVSSPLPALTEATTVDGLTQPSATPANPLIRLRNASLVAVDGLTISAGPSLVRGLTIGNFFVGSAIRVASGTGTRIQGNRIGTDPTGTSADPNGTGVLVDASAAETEIGCHPTAPDPEVQSCEAAGQGNLVAFNRIGIQTHSPAVIAGNRIDANAAGTANLALSFAVGVDDRAGSQIGGIGPTAPPVEGGLGPGNVIGVGESGQGIALAAPGSRVQGNLIGTSADGTARITGPALGDASGIAATGVPGARLIGGPQPGARNVISGIDGAGSAGITSSTSPDSGGLAIENNLIGTDAAGNSAIPNETGVDITTRGGTLTENTIAYNTGTGVITQLDTRLSANRIYDNGGLGIDIFGDGFSPTTSEAFATGPALVYSDGEIVWLNGIVFGPANSTLTVELFTSPACDPSNSGEGATFVDRFTVATRSNGFGNYALIRDAHVAPGEVVTATVSATGTSEFSGCVTAQPLVVPTLTTAAATNVGPSGALLRGRVTSGSLDNMTYFFEYGPDTNYGTRTPQRRYLGDTPALAAVTGLPSGTTIHYRLVLASLAGHPPIQGPDQQFTTPAGPATLTVNTTADNAPAAGQCSGAAGDCAMRQALDTAGVGDVIALPASPDPYPQPMMTGLEALPDMSFRGAAANRTTVGGTVSGAQSSDLTLEDLTIDPSKGPPGGAAVSGSFGLLQLRRARIVHGAHGGVVWSNGSVTIDSSLIDDNVRPAGEGFGAGISQTSGALRIVNSTITGNTSTAAAGTAGGGGGIHKLHGGLTIYYSTVAGNSAEGLPGAPGRGGNILLSGIRPTLEVFETIVANGQPANCELSGAASFTGFNIESRNTCGFTDPTDLVDTDPLLGPLGDHGGPTPTLVPGPGSPAIDIEHEFQCHAGFAGILDTDARGGPRPFPLPLPTPDDGGCDAGAVEIGPPPTATLGAATDVTATAATLHGTVDPQSFDATYRFEYSTDMGFASSTSPAVRPAAEGAGEVAATVTGLTPQTEYRFRLTARTGDGTVTTGSGTFTTPAVPSPPSSPPRVPPPPPPATLPPPLRCLGRAVTIAARPGVVTRGTVKADVILGTNGPDRIVAGGGNDRICSGSGADTVRGGAGRDRVLAGPGNDVVRLAGGGRDSVRCGAGRDAANVDRADRANRCERLRRRSHA